MITTFYFDTNVFLGTNDAQCRHFRAVADSNGIECKCPPRVFIELFSHINSDEQDCYFRYRAALRRQREICSFNFLPYFQWFLADHFGLKRQFPEITPPGDFIRTRGYIIDSADYPQFLGKMPRFGVEESSGREFQFENYWRDFREEYENSWLEAVFPWVADLLGEEVSRSKIAEAIDSSDFKRRYLLTLIEIAVGQRYEMPFDRVDEVIPTVEAHISAFQTLLKDRADGRYKRDTFQNFFNDLELLIYLACEGYAFVTLDRKLRGKVAKSCQQRRRILAFDEAMDFMRR